MTPLHTETYAVCDMAWKGVFGAVHAARNQKRLGYYLSMLAPRLLSRRATPRPLSRQPGRAAPRLLSRRGCATATISAQGCVTSTYLGRAAGLRLGYVAALLTTIIYIYLDRLRCACGYYLGTRQGHAAARATIRSRQGHTAATVSAGLPCSYYLVRAVLRRLESQLACLPTSKHNDLT